MEGGVKRGGDPSPVCFWRILHLEAGSLSVEGGDEASDATIASHLDK